jgi:MFS family permease
MASPQTTEPASRAPRGALWRHADFLKLWTGQSLSLIGTQVTVLALPYVAVVLLQASAAEMGVLSALAQLPMVLFPLVGVWVDQMRRRPLMIWTDLGRATILATIPVLYLADMLSLEWLYLVVVVAGVLGVMFEIANRSYLPSLVEREQLAEGNSKLQLSQSVALAAGPGLAGLLVSMVSAALIILIDVASYLVSAVACLFIRKPEPAPGEGQRGHVLAAIWEGLRWVLGQPLLRPTAIATAFYTFLSIGVIQTLYVLYVVRELRLSVGWLGFVLAAGGVGAILGAWVSVPVMERLGLGRAMLWSTIVGNISLLLIPLAAQPAWLAVAMLATPQFIMGVCSQVYMVNHATLWQSITPGRLQGRVVATFLSLGLAPAPLGALAAGFLAEAIGLRATLLLAVLGTGIPILALLFSPIPAQRGIPQPDKAAA